jgi:hypothetical protein
LKESDLADALLQSLKKGNLQSVAVEKDGGAARMFVEANPQYKTLNLYDGNLKRVPKEDLRLYTGQEPVKEPQQSQKQDSKKGHKQKNENAETPPKATKQKGIKRSAGR